MGSSVHTEKTVVRTCSTRQSSRKWCFLNWDSLKCLQRRPVKIDSDLLSRTKKVNLNGKATIRNCKTQHFLIVTIRHYVTQSSILHREDACVHSGSLLMPQKKIIPHVIGPFFHPHRRIGGARNFFFSSSGSDNDC